MFIQGLNDIAARYDHFIIDIFGVIHDGIRPFPDTKHTLGTLRDQGKQVCLLSNSPRIAAGAADQLNRMGLGHDLFDHIVTSGEATHQALKHSTEIAGKHCWFIGTGIMGEVFQGLDYHLLDGPQGADFILNSIPGTQDSEKEALITNFKSAIEMNLPMICANPDLVVNIGEHQYECAGTFAKIYEDLGGTVIYHGKPHAPVYERCYELLGQPDKSKIIAIGDSLHTDIAGANHFGIDSIFNLVGIHWEEVQMDHRPGQADLKKIDAMLDAYPNHPTYTMAGFCW